jgi:hypothetical protein
VQAILYECKFGSGSDHFFQHIFYILRVQTSKLPTKAANNRAVIAKAADESKIALLREGALDADCTGQAEERSARSKLAFEDSFPVSERREVSRMLVPMPPNTAMQIKNRSGTGPARLPPPCPSVCIFVIVKWDP